MAEGRLKVFISSKMAELRDVRDVVGAALDQRGINGWVYESDATADPDTVVGTSLREVAEADVYVGLFWKQLGQVTVDEFKEARRLGKPCFVYIRDRDASRDVDLDAFLKREVKDLDRGVTYRFFDRATMLGAQVAGDVMTWLVRTHRETTAQLAEASNSRAEVARLQEELERLRSASRIELPSGEPMDFLAQQLRGWLTALGYQLERDETRGTSHFEWVVNVPARRGYDRVVLHGVNGELRLSDVTRLRESVTRQHGVEGWVVALRRVSDAARRAVEGDRTVLCFTLDELIDQDADFGGYLTWLEGEIERRGIDRMYVPLACTVDEIDPKTGQRVAVSRYDETNGWIDGYIDRWLDDPSKEHVSVLGEFGTGKTWFTLHYAYRQLQRYKAAKENGTERPRLPIVVPLRDYAKAVSAESLFSEFFFRKHEINLRGYSVFEQLNRMGKLLLIFDGFDEMAARVDRQRMINNFWELARVVVPGAKAILTCRTEHFPQAREGRDLLNAQLKASTSDLTGEPPQFEVIELQPLAEAQIRQLLSQRTSAATIDAVMQEPELRELLSRPVMSELVLDALPDIEAGKPVDLARVYLYAVRNKMERDIKSERTFTSLADKLFFLCELSFEMLQSDRLSINYREFPDRLRRCFGPMVEAEKDLDHWHYDMMGQTILIRNADGDYAPAHRSLIEFFSAYKLAAQLGVLAADFAAVAADRPDVDTARDPELVTWSRYFEYRPASSPRIAPLAGFAPEPLDRLRETLGREPVTDLVRRLLVSIMINDEATLTDRLYAVLTSTTGKGPEEAGFVGGNAASLLVERVPDALRGRQLAGMNLAGADFGSHSDQGCDLRDANLEGAFLRGCGFEHTDLRGAVLRRADLEGSHGWFVEPNFCGPVAALPGSNELVAGGSGVVVRLTRDDRSENVCDELSWVSSLAVSPDGQLIVAGDFGGRTIAFDTATSTRIMDVQDHDDFIVGASINRSGSAILTASEATSPEGGSLRAYGMDGRRRWHHQQPEPFKTLCVAPEADVFVTLDWRGGVDLWDARTFAHLKNVHPQLPEQDKYHHTRIQCARPTSKGDLLLLANRKAEESFDDWLLWMVEVRSGDRVWELDASQLRTGEFGRDRHGQPAGVSWYPGFIAAVHPEGAKVAFAIYADLLVWDVRADEASWQVLNAHELTPLDISFVDGGRSLLTSSEDCLVKRWDSQTGALLASFSTSQHYKDLDLTEVTGLHPRIAKGLERRGAHLGG